MSKKKKRNTRRNRKAPVRSLPKPKNQKKKQLEPMKFLVGLAEHELETTLGGWKPDFGTFVADKLNIFGITKHSQLLLGPCYVNTIAPDEEGLLINFAMGLSCFGGKSSVYLGSMIIKGKKPREMLDLLELSESGVSNQGVNCFVMKNSYPLVFIKCRVVPNKRYTTYQTEESVVPFFGEVFLHNGPLVREAIEESTGFNFSELGQVLILREGFGERIRLDEEKGKDVFEKLFSSESGLSSEDESALP